MKHVFYFFAIVAIIWEINVLLSPKKVHGLKDQIKGKKFNEYSDSVKGLAFCMFAYLIWTIVGLFTVQWPVFVLMIILGVIPKKHWTMRFANAFISLCLLIFVILNSYHFHIHLWSEISKYLGL